MGKLIVKNLMTCVYLTNAQINAYPLSQPMTDKYNSNSVAANTVNQLLDVPFKERRNVIPWAAIKTLILTL